MEKVLLQPSGRHTSILWGKMLRQPSGRHTSMLWKKRVASIFGTQGTARSLKRRYVYTRLHGVTHQKTALFVDSRSSNLTSIVIFTSEVIWAGNLECLQGVFLMYWKGGLLSNRTPDARRTSKCWASLSSIINIRGLPENVKKDLGDDASHEKPKLC